MKYLLFTSFLILQWFLQHVSSANVNPSTRARGHGGSCVVRRDFYFSASQIKTEKKKDETLTHGSDGAADKQKGDCVGGDCSSLSSAKLKSASRVRLFIMCPVTDVTFSSRSRCVVEMIFPF